MPFGRAGSIPAPRTSIKNLARERAKLPKNEDFGQVSVIARADEIELVMPSK